MNTESEILRRATRMVPLIRSITTEARERRRSIRHLGSRLKELSSLRGAGLLESRRLEFELLLHREEMKSLQKELARLGCRMDSGCPGRIVWQLRGGHEVLFERSLVQSKVSQTQLG